MKRKIGVIAIFVLSFMMVFSACSKASVLEHASRDLSVYKIEAFYNKEEHTVSGKMELTFVNSFSQPLTELVFSLWANGFTENATYGPVSATNKAKAYPNGESYGKIEVSDVKVNQKVVQHVVDGQDNTSLTLPLEESIYEKQKAKITLNFISTLPNANLRFGYGDNTVNITGFFPILSVFTSNGWVKNPYSSNGDPFFTDCANYEVAMSAHKTFVLASTGSTILKQDYNDTTTHYIKATAVRDFAMVLSTQFQIKEQIENDTLVKYYYFADTNPDQSLTIACQSIKTFENLFGDYPYSTLSVVESNFVHGGMEFPQLVMISNTLSSREQQNEVIVHEISHQWWYGLVGSNAFAHGWLDEGLAEFSTALFFEKNPQYNISKQQVIANANHSYLLFVDVYTEVFGAVDTSMNRPLNAYKTEPEYVYVAYVKGLLMYDNLYKLMGEKKFLKALQTLVTEKRFKNIEPAELITTFQKTNRTNLEGFFNSWLQGKVTVVGK